MAITLRNGSSGDDVKRLQMQLNSILKLNPPLTADGKFGLKTERAVQAFQAQFNLGVDGIAGPKTQAALNAKALGKPISPSTPPPSPIILSSSNAPWLPIAKAEADALVKNVPGPQAHPRIVEYHQTTTLKSTSDETAWCSAFVNWCLKQVGITGTRSAAAASWVNWGTGCNAAIGAITVIHNPAMVNTALSRSGNHVGFLAELNANYYVLLGGNQSGRVKVSTFTKTSWQLKGYRWPST